MKKIGFLTLFFLMTFANLVFAFTTDEVYMTVNSMVKCGRMTTKIIVYNYMDCKQFLNVLNEKGFTCEWKTIHIPNPKVLPMYYHYDGHGYEILATLPKLSKVACK